MSRPKLLLHWLTAAAVVACSLASARRALGDENAEAAAAVRGLLERGWQSSGDARPAVEDFYAKIPAVTRADQRVAYAYALALIKLRRDNDAARVVAEVAAADNPHPGILYAHLWLTMLTKQYDLALLQMVRSAALLSPFAAANPPPPDTVQTASRLGTLFGFLEGPAEGSVPPAKLNESRAKILAALPPSLAAPFTAAQTAVKQQHTQWIGNQAQSEQQAEQQAEAERQRLFDAAQAERAQIAQRRGELADQLDKLREELQSALETLRAAESPVAEQSARVRAELRLQEEDLLRTLDEIARLGEILRRTRDPQLRQELLLELDRLERLADRIRLRLAQTDREAAVLDARLLELRSQAATTQGRYQRDIGQRQDEQNRLTRREAQLGRMEQQAQRRKADRGRTRALGVRATALTSYASFPLEEEKRRLLDSL